MSVRLSAWKNSAPTERIFMKFYIWVFLENLLRKSKFRYNQKIIMDTLHEDQYIFLIISHSVLHRMGSVSDRFGEKIKTHILCSVTCFSPKNCAVCKIMWKKFVQPGRPQMIIYYALNAGYLRLQTHTQSM